jgi:hypothetical protein
MVDDVSAPKDLVIMAVDLLANKERQSELSANISKMALPNAARVIAEKVLELTGEKE